MNSILHDITRPWSYLDIRHETKWIYDTLIPFLLTVSSAIPLVWLYAYDKIDLYSKDGVLRDLISLIATLPGFFIAALAAIATFQINDIDETMPLPTILPMRFPNGHDQLVQLTRRRFLCSLFSYLTAQSIFICVTFIIAIHLSEGLSGAWHIWNETVLGATGLVVFLLAFWNLLSSTALVLYYLGDRLHHPKN